MKGRLEKGPKSKKEKERTEMIPTTTLGNLQIQASQDAVLHKVWTLEMIPTKATVHEFSDPVNIKWWNSAPGIAQKMMRAAVAA